MAPQSPESILLVGENGETQVGTHFSAALSRLKKDCRFADARQAQSQSRLLNFLGRMLAGGGPGRIKSFSKTVRRQCQEAQAGILLSVGLAPVNAKELRAIGEMGVKRVAFLTDDPWNRDLHASWFLESAAEYDCLFTPRRANLEQLAALGPRTHYLPFAYSPELHFPAKPFEIPQPDDGPDVAFAGTATDDRAAVIAALADAGLKIALYGELWDQFPQTKSLARGVATAETLRDLAHSAKVSVCLVGKANRDGHSRRSFELPAMGACVLAEDTEEHRAIYADEGENVLYFRDLPALLAKARELVADRRLRDGLRRHCHRWITFNRNQYQHRAATILAALEDRAK